MSGIRPLSDEEVKLVKRYQKLQREYTNFKLRSSVLRSSIDLIDAIVQSVEDTNAADSSDIALLGFLSRRKAEAYTRLANLPLAIRWFEVLHDKTLTELKQRLSS